MEYKRRRCLQSGRGWRIKEEAGGKPKEGAGNGFRGRTDMRARLRPSPVHLADTRAATRARLWVALGTWDCVSQRRGGRAF